MVRYIVHFTSRVYAVVAIPVLADSVEDAKRVGKQWLERMGFDTFLFSVQAVDKAG